MNRGPVPARHRETRHRIPELPVIATGLFGNGHLSAPTVSFLVLSFHHSLTLWLKFGWQHTCKTRNSERIPNREPRVLFDERSEKKTMPYIEHARDTLMGPMTEDYLEKRIREGWKPVVVEWQREVPGEKHETSQMKIGTPYGLRVADDCLNLEQDPAEASVLTLLLELVREDGPFSRIADILNARGFHTRRGTKWTEVDVFKLLPRLIDAAPDLRRSRGKAVNRGS